MRVKNECAGKRVKCPECGAAAVVPTSESHDSEIAPLDFDNTKLTVKEESCPSCGEQILVTAKKCKLGGKFLSSAPTQCSHGIADEYHPLPTL